MNYASHVFSTDCHSTLVLQWTGPIGEFYKDVEKYIGVYRQKHSKIKGHYVYEKFENLTATFLFYKEGLGWRVSNSIDYNVSSRNFI